ncbi:unnamed protein product [Schistosoma mattheei]|uniref:Uncharacterized protein n=1 Tax=Schistosoma mattheei TaxID=31246 RepID=A0A3P8GVM3_9TREM|nr:unnamed protein product [Schistosoma mattheei]
MPPLNGIDPQCIGTIIFPTGKAASDQAENVSGDFLEQGFERLFNPSSIVSVKFAKDSSYSSSTIN